jgi:hypothetical protein
MPGRSNTAVPGAAALRVLQVIDRLEVGPARVEPRRVTAAYTVTQGGRTESRDLVFRFHEDVFAAAPAGAAGAGPASSRAAASRVAPESARARAADAGARNLAAMMAAQIAVNYGLFCREIVFHGPLDGADRQFLAEMSAITARDIFVRKLLRPKPFFDPWVERLPAVQLDSYSQARLVFPETPPAPRGRTATSRAAPESARAAGSASRRAGPLSDPPLPAWDVGPGAPRTALLASGGKDSLLTHRLLAECGQETHPLFVNESGRHWFTALNAYRHHAAAVPHTGRVWTNSDRVFSWLLRHLPFVHADYHRHAWPGYPIRVWTVPVFLFGVLPLLRRRRVARLAAGNELDTTAYGSHEGIDHYYCLYDQSRDFERRLNDYFRQKRWGVQLFSVLRSMSGLLIQKQLLRRYPESLPLQMSCHRAHPGAGCMLPCGRCEKCIGVMASLVACGGDPLACGYSREQVARCLAELPARGTWQEPAAVEHLGYLLAARGLLPAATVGGFAARPRPEVMQLRFDGERSDLDDLPADLRRPLLTLLLAQADGAVRLAGDRWVAFDPLREPLAVAAAPR